ncbi:MAG: rRNA maturation RNase YbeY [Rikenellaceae bacterium]
MAISFSTLDCDFSCKNRRKIASFLKSIIVEAGCKVGDISVVFCSDEQILETNRTYLQHDYFTDIITFDYCEGGVVSGDLIISIDTVKNNSETFNVSFIDELHRVIIHGVLHLLGQGDKSKNDAKEMRRKEDLNLEKLAKHLG